MIRLVGGSGLPVATKAIDEAAERISHYLLMQSVINGTFGATVALGLFLIGLPYAVLWGFLAAVLRFIPYVGAWLAALMPLTLALAVFQGWQQPLFVLALFAALEPLIFLVVEPLLYGRGTGVSDVALLVAAFFWTWLWGPVGLLLATPLTVCLVVLGKYVPDLGFLGVLLGEAPAARAARRLLPAAPRRGRGRGGADRGGVRPHEPARPGVRRGAAARAQERQARPGPGRPHRGGCPLHRRPHPRDRRGAGLPPAPAAASRSASWAAPPATSWTSWPC